MNLLTWSYREIGKYPPSINLSSLPGNDWDISSRLQNTVFHHWFCHHNNLLIYYTAKGTTYKKVYLTSVYMWNCITSARLSYLSMYMCRCMYGRRWISFHPRVYLPYNLYNYCQVNNDSLPAGNATLMCCLHCEPIPHYGDHFAKRYTGVLRASHKQVGVRWFVPAGDWLKVDVFRSWLVCWPRRLRLLVYSGTCSWPVCSPTGGARLIKRRSLAAGDKCHMLAVEL